MDTNKRFLVRITILGAVFLYIAYLAWQQLTRFDFTVIVSFFALFFLWTLTSEKLVYKAPDTYVIEDADNKSFLYLQLTFLIALFYAAIDFVELAFTRYKPLEPNIIYLGFILFIISCLIRWWGYNSIGKFFNPRVALYEDHQLIIEGAYKKLRHPIYLGDVIGFIAITLIFNSWGAMLIILCTTIPALIYRIKIEEEFMLRHFPEAYSAYLKNTKRLIPGVW